jgi:phospholipase C
MAVKYVVTLMLENRSFDHMLGYSGITGTDAVSGAPTAVEGVPAGVADAGPARYCLPVGPKHDFPDVARQLATPDGFVASYAEEIAAKGSPPGADAQDAMRCFRSSQQLPVLHQLAEEFVVFDRWFASMPGPTWPNRFFVHAASSGGLDHSPSAVQMAVSYPLRPFSFEHGHVFQRLQQHGVDWAVLSGGWLPQCFAMEGMHEFWMSQHHRDMKDMDALLDEIARRDRAYVFIEPTYGDFLNDTYKGGTSQHAVDDVTRGEWLLKAVYEKLRNHAVWDDCALIVTWDEHGGFWDHVIPPQATPPGDHATNDDNTKHGFGFDRYGVRVPALLVSPRAARNQVDHRVHDHSTVVAMLQELWPDLGSPFTARDAAQVNAHSTPAGLLSNDPRGDSPHRARRPQAHRLPARRRPALHRRRPGLRHPGDPAARRRAAGRHAERHPGGLRPRRPSHGRQRRPAAGAAAGGRRLQHVAGVGHRLGGAVPQRDAGAAAARTDHPVHMKKRRTGVAPIRRCERSGLRLP